ncbi:hypothetical protein HELRODRAFT_168277 [Helobdella robusta]|uniref:Uncharacterized protein n=1 Tax=Helobdella robusta TaxID=6412 RepID=T1F0E2_HELRO|nr:hypothetical protein HELRODRAFT_168277 [Helobdella robusta]ESO09313.1 hypothetical protein HELRODRAFT_168277 [Helobdella robusta]
MHECLKQNLYYVQTNNINVTNRVGFKRGQKHSRNKRQKRNSQNNLFSQFSTNNNRLKKHKTSSSQDELLQTITNQNKRKCTRVAFTLQFNVRRIVLLRSAVQRDDDPTTPSIDVFQFPTMILFIIRRL